MDREPIGAQLCLEPGRQRLVRRQAEAGGEAVAEGEDLGGLRDRLSGAKGHAQQRAAKRNGCATDRPPQARHRVKVHRDNPLPQDLASYTGERHGARQQRYGAAL